MEDVYIVHEYKGDEFREVEIKIEDRKDLNLELSHPEYFIDLWINGEQIDEADYDVRDGSVVITLRAQTFGNLDRDSSHVIAAEFKNKDGEQYKVAQNFRFNVTEREPDTDTDNGKNNTGNSPKNQSSTPKTESVVIITNESIPLGTLSESETVPQSHEPFEPVIGNFIDVKQTDWFFEDIQWAYQNQIMIGISETEFAPSTPASPAMIALTLAHMLDVDLSGYDQAGSAWYSAAMAWAENIDFFDGITGFSPHIKMERGQLMVVIERALHLAGVNAVVTDEFIAFSDADEMTAEELKIFRLFYELGIVHGRDDGAMDPRGVSTRAELAAILHRIEEHMHENMESNDKAL